MRTYRQVPNTPPAYRIAETVNERDIAALRALEHGEASPEQQKLALRLVLVKVSGLYDQTVVLGHADQTTFRGGRQYVGQVLMKFLRTDINLLLGDNPHAET